VPVNAEITFLLIKEQRPFKLKKEYPSEQWQIISFRLIPLKTPVSFRWTVPLRQPRIQDVVLLFGKTNYSSLNLPMRNRGWMDSARNVEKVGDVYEKFKT
jgi:hypothetical protein